ncbi:MAG: Holliday junction branch migration protein RuvA [Clostridiales bacterium]|nr:Holliday junction branch migration protein RuvA [Clostridiales bacterium]MCD8323860.1 Holliday junction branch migration protein RuvA [Clostridiales bacterium]
MYAYIRGTLEEVREDYIVVENNGIGYQISVPMRILEELPERGAEVKIYTYLYVREDIFSLFGFSTQDELAMFRLLLNVSGIGPKGALGILSALSVNDIRFAVVSEDIKTITKAPGIGKKGAQRLIIELKDKISLEDAYESALEDGLQEVPETMQIVKKEAMEALVALGYSSADAARALSGIEISDDSDVETVLRMALRSMALL